jgi:hypothetical protein
MSYFGALPVPSLAQQQEGSALEPFSDGARIVLMPKQAGGEPFWAKADDVLAAYAKAPQATKHYIPRVLGPADRAGGKVSSTHAVSGEDVALMAAKFRSKAAPAKKALTEVEKKMLQPTMSAPQQRMLQTGIAVVAVLGVGALLLRRRRR